VQSEINVPIIDCAEAAVKQAELAIAMNSKVHESKKLPPKISIGVEKELADYLSHKS
jgi:hypothetical protein